MEVNRNPNYIRALHLYEQVLVGSNVAAVLMLTANNLDHKDVQQALLLTREEHPFVRMRLSTSQENVKLGYVEDRTQTHDVEFETANTDDSSWEERLSSWSSRPRDSTKSLVYVKLVTSVHNNSNHQIYVVANHCGLDGPGMLHLLHSLATHLATVLEHKQLSSITTTTTAPVSRPFVDILSRYSIPENLAKPAPALPANFVPSVSGVMRDTSPEKLRPISVVWSELDQVTTTKLVENCREHSSTVQAALTVAGMVAVLVTRNSDKDNSNTHETEYTFLNQAPINMRSQVEPPVDAGDIACGSAALWWQQRCTENDKLWSVVEEASRNIREQVSAKSALAWWARINTGKFDELRPYTLMTSSLGVTPIQEYYGQQQSVHVTGLKFLGGQYESEKDAAATTGGTMTHVHTTLGRLNTNFNYTTRFFSRAWALQFAKAEQDVLRLLASDDAGNMTLGHVVEQVRQSSRVNL